jgi:hypothetical protein
MSAARFTYQQLVQLVDGDDELIVRLVDEGLIARGEGDLVRVDLELVLAARTLWRDLEVEWSGIELILRLRDELVQARRRIGELEQELSGTRKG